MLNVIWFVMIIISVVCSIITGRVSELSKSIGAGADKAVGLIVSMAGVMCLWSGVMKIAEKSGLTVLLSRLLMPVIGRLLPDYRENRSAMSAVSANVTANILGLGNAATPLGIAAMKGMQRTNRLRDRPNDSMIMFVLLNTASVQIIPTTTAALRQAAGSSEPYGIVPFVWAASGLALLAGIAAAKLFCITIRLCHNKWLIFNEK